MADRTGPAGSDRPHLVVGGPAGSDRPHLVVVGGPAGSDRPHLVVVGLMGVGKTTTARAIAEALGLPTHDSDADILTLFGTTGGELATEHGIDELHRIEAGVLLGRLAAQPPSVIAAAAWTVEDPRCREAMQLRSRVIMIDAPIDEVLRRIATGSHRRSMDLAELEAIHTRRAPWFDAVADLRVDGTKSTTEMVASVLDCFEDETDAP